MMMKKIILSFLATIGFLTLAGVISLVMLVRSFFHSPLNEQEKVTDSTILTLKVGSVPFVDVAAPHDFWSFLSTTRSVSLFDTVMALQHAALDDRIKGVFLTIEGSTLTLAQAQELREVLTLLKEKNKKIYAFAYSFGEGGRGTTPYYLATIADKIFMQPQGSLELTGYAIESYFLRDLLNKHKIKPQLDRRENYKGIIETYTQNDFSTHTRENLKLLLEDMATQVNVALSHRFNLPPQQVKDLMEAAPYLGPVSVEKKLITDLLHKDEVENLFSNDADTKSTFMSVKAYQKQVPPVKTETKFALISVDGEIASPTSAYTHEPSLSLQAAKQLQQASKDPSVQAIILRIDSPGGTVTGAETIWYEVNRITHKVKKPVIVSMGTLAASAGYQIAAPATKIVANPGTITGSIGVATGKIAISEALAEFGINLRQIQTASSATMWSMSEEFSAKEWEKIQASLDYYYDLFLKKVAKGRHLTIAQTHTHAKGQVWTGRQAKEKGLVDELGGFLKAIEIAKRLTNIPLEMPVEIMVMEEPLFTDSLLGRLFESMEFVSSLARNIKLINSQQALIQEKLEIIPQ